MVRFNVDRGLAFNKLLKNPKAYVVIDDYADEMGTRKYKSAPEHQSGSLAA